MSRGSVNKVILIGRLGKDPDMRYAPSGTAIASFSVATNHRTKNQEGSWVDQTEWHSVKCFGKQAEFAGEYLKKGRQVFIEGRIQSSSWEDQNGQKHYRTDIIANEFQLLGSRGDADGAQAQAPAPAAAQSKPQKPQQAEEPPVEEDDLPF